jgi:hypothetical protein
VKAEMESSVLRSIPIWNGKIKKGETEGKRSKPVAFDRCSIVQIVKVNVAATDPI